MIARGRIVAFRVVLRMVREHEEVIRIDAVLLKKLANRHIRSDITVGSPELDVKRIRLFLREVRINKYDHGIVGIFRHGVVDQGSKSRVRFRVGTPVVLARPSMPALGFDREMLLGCVMDCDKLWVLRS